MVLCAIVTSMKRRRALRCNGKRVTIVLRGNRWTAQRSPRFKARAPSVPLGDPTTLKQGSGKRNVSPPRPLAE